MKKTVALVFFIFYFSSLIYGFKKQESLYEMKAVFFPSAVCFFLADGGEMIIDIGQGTNPKMLQIINENLRPKEVVFNVFPPLGWKPRIDWLIMTSRGNVWDSKILDLINNYTFGSIYFPHRPDTYRTGSDKKVIHAGVSKIMLEIALSRNKISSLESVKEIDLAQSNSNIRCEKLELESSPLPAMGSQSALCLLLTYRNTKILIASELTDEQQQYVLNNSSAKIKADIIYYTRGVNPCFVNAVGAKWCISVDDAMKTFKLDGNSIVETRN